MPPMDAIQLRALSAQDLRDECRKKKLSSAGNKAALIERLELNELTVPELQAKILAMGLTNITGAKSELISRIQDSIAAFKVAAQAAPAEDKQDDQDEPQAELQADLDLGSLDLNAQGPN